MLDQLAHDLDHHAELLAKADASLSTVPAYNRNFTGRFDELLALRERLIKDDRTGVIYGKSKPNDLTIVATRKCRANDSKNRNPETPE